MSTTTSKPKYISELLLNTDFFSNISLPTSNINNWTTTNCELIQYTLNNNNKRGVKINNILDADLQQTSKMGVIQVGTYNIKLNIDLLNWEPIIATINIFIFLTGAVYKLTRLTSNENIINFGWKIHPRATNILGKPITIRIRQKQPTNSSDTFVIINKCSLSYSPTL
jgi:hypothetical protein